jgi:hypothetical protein
MKKEQQKQEPQKQKSHEHRTDKEMAERSLPDGYGIPGVEELLKGW